MGVMQPALRIWGRMYDGTPARHWTHVVKKDGQMQGQTSIAQVMAALLTCSMVLEVRPILTLDATGCSIGTAVGDPPPCCVIGALQAVPPNGRQDHQRFVITRGSRLTAMGSRPTAMGQQPGNVVRECIRQGMSLQPDVRSTVDAVFPQDAFSTRPTCKD